MKVLKDLPPGTIWPHLLEAIERKVIAEMQLYAESRKKDVVRGAETPGLAAVLVEKYGEGMARALHIAGLDSQVQREVDRLVREIDPDFETTKKARWAAKKAALTFEA
jgi:hypothetical protein